MIKAQTDAVWRTRLQLSERPSDYLTLELDRRERRIRLREVNGAIYIDVPCPAVAAGERNETDPVCECPVCLWEHIDDDSNPGIMDGTQEDCERERAGALADWGEGRAEVMAEVRARNGWNPRKDCIEEVRYGR